MVRIFTYIFVVVASAYVACRVRDCHNDVVGKAKVHSGMTIRVHRRIPILWVDRLAIKRRQNTAAKFRLGVERKTFARLSLS